eukprot:TRINITY_DN50304_c0_g1_i1.p1 TRINITY_DN50304_c0_g1~~TRINITY_DN50304_c0_g1_i1.p1  ORF type:complete len:682 (-),score=82.62 TRINITY_DN50304_c0_g1_i1:72-2117(-)
MDSPYLRRRSQSSGAALSPPMVRPERSISSASSGTGSCAGMAGVRTVDGANTELLGSRSTPNLRCSVSLGSPGQLTPAERTPAAGCGRLFGMEALPVTPCLGSPLTTPTGRARATRDSRAGGAAASWLDSAMPLKASAAATKRLDRQEAQLQCLTDEVAVVRACLEQAGLLKEPQYQVRLHRQRFHRLLQTHPLHSDADILQAMSVHELASAIARAAALPGIQALSATSRGCRQAMSGLQRELTSMFASSILVVGGFGERGTWEGTAERFHPETGIWEVLPSLEAKGCLIGTAVIRGSLYAFPGAGPQIPAIPYADEVPLGATSPVAFERPPLTLERFDPAAGSWEKLAAPRKQHWNAATAVLHGRIYVCGGFDGGERKLPEVGPLQCVERFDPAIGRWEQLPRLNVGRDGARCAIAALKGCLYLCGGTWDSSVERFDDAADEGRGEWQDVAPMSVARSNSACAVVGGRLYLCGGTDHSECPLWSTERFDPECGCWETLPPMTDVRVSPAVGVVAGKIYLCGGTSGVSPGSFQYLSSAESFDPASPGAGWSSLPPMSAQRGFATTAVLDGKLYVIGGRGGVEFRRSVERFDPELGTWELLPPMRERRSMSSAAVIWSCRAAAGCTGHAAPPATGLPRATIEIIEDPNQFNLERAFPGWTSPLTITGTPQVNAQHRARQRLR